jgi:hypothetical protein
MLNNKISTKTKLFLFVLNTKTTFNKNIINKFLFGSYMKKVLFSNNTLNFFLLKFIKLIYTFNIEKRHILLIFSENISVYFMLQLTNAFLKNQRRISLINEKSWYNGNLKNTIVFEKQLLKKKTFDLLTGFNFKPELVVIFGLNNDFIIKDLIYFNLPFILLGFKKINLNINKTYYFIPFNCIDENIIFIFIIKYAFLYKW